MMLARRVAVATFAVTITAVVGAAGCGRGASDGATKAETKAANTAANTAAKKTAANAASEAAARTVSDSDVLAKRDARMKAALAQTDSGAPNPTPLARWLLPASLKEVSGLALTADGRLLAHDDSHGRVSEIDYRRGTIVKRFALEPKVDHVDFEGITVADSVVFLLASNGTLYEFAEGADGAHVPYTVHDTELGSECEFEGVAFDRALKSLLLACKIVKTPAMRDSLVIYRWKLANGLTRAARLSRLTVPIAAVAAANGWKTVHPSDITIDPKNGHYVMVASKDKAIIEITPTGVIVSARPLPGEHAQPEGLAITKDRILIVSDEAAGGTAVITLYRLP